MNVKELKDILNQYPDDMEIWVSNRGYCEGGERLVKVEKVVAYEAGLDCDKILDEWIYTDADTNLSEYKLQDFHLFIKLVKQKNQNITFWFSYKLLRY